jgi:Tol biopolymer transport system component
MNRQLQSCLLGACLIASASGPAIAQAPNRQPPPPSHGASPKVSPDGKAVLFSRDSGGQRSAYVMGADGSNQRSISVASGSPSSISWFPDSKRVFVVVRGQNRAAPVRMAIMKVDGTDVTEVAMNGLIVAGAALMPDGKTIMLASATRDSAGRVVSMQQYFADIDGSHVRPFAIPAIAGRMLSALVPSPDGRRMALTVADTSDPAMIFKATTLWVMNADGSALKALATLSDGLEQPTWSPDGRKIALHDDHPPKNRALVPADYVPDANIVVVDAATGAIQQLTHHDRRYLDEVPSWSKDGRIYFQSNRDGQMEIYRMNADGSNPQRLTK